MKGLSKGRYDETFTGEDDIPLVVSFVDVVFFVFLLLFGCMCFSIVFLYCFFSWDFSSFFVIHGNL